MRYILWIMAGLLGSVLFGMPMSSHATMMRTLVQQAPEGMASLGAAPTKRPLRFQTHSQRQLSSSSIPAAPSSETIHPLLEPVPVSKQPIVPTNAETPLAQELRSTTPAQPMNPTAIPQAVPQHLVGPTPGPAVQAMTPQPMIAMPQAMPQTAPYSVTTLAPQPAVQAMTPQPVIAMPQAVITPSPQTIPQNVPPQKPAVSAPTQPVINTGLAPGQVSSATERKGFFQHIIDGTLGNNIRRYFAERRYFPNRLNVFLTNRRIEQLKSRMEHLQSSVGLNSRKKIDQIFAIEDQLSTEYNRMASLLGAAALDTKDIMKANALQENSRKFESLSDELILRLQSRSGDVSPL